MAIAVDLTHTSHCPVLTGVQRVCHEILQGLEATGANPQTLIYDRYAKRWRGLDTEESARLSAKAPPPRKQSRGQTWTFWQEYRGRLGLVSEPDWNALRGSALLAPEIFHERNFCAYAQLRARLGGAAGAVFYDAVVLRLPEFSQTSIVARFPSYLRELAAFDGIAAISEASRNELLEHWDRLHLRITPPVVAIPLGVEAPAKLPTPPPVDNDANGPLVLCVSTLEGRKNQIALLNAAEVLWREGLRFRLVLAGVQEPRTGRAAIERAKELQAAGRPLELTGAVSEARLQELYTACRFTVYPSLYEGFGLPVAESLLRHRPCLCGPGGALAEIAAKGGCYLVPRPTAEHLADGLRALLQNEAHYQQLTAEAAQRTFRTWKDYAQDISAWLSQLRPRAVAPLTPPELMRQDAAFAEAANAMPLPFLRQQEECNDALIAAQRAEAEGLTEVTTRLNRLKNQLRD